MKHFIIIITASLKNALKNVPENLHRQIYINQVICNPVG